MDIVVVVVLLVVVRNYALDRRGSEGGCRHRGLRYWVQPGTGYGDRQLFGLVSWQIQTGGCSTEIECNIMTPPKTTRSDRYPAHTVRIPAEPATPPIFL